MLYLQRRIVEDSRSTSSALVNVLNSLSVADHQYDCLARRYWSSEPRVKLPKGLMCREPLFFGAEFTIVVSFHYSSHPDIREQGPTDLWVPLSVLSILSTGVPSAMTVTKQSCLSKILLLDFSNNSLFTWVVTVLVDRVESMVPYNKGVRKGKPTTVFGLCSRLFERVFNLPSVSSEGRHCITRRYFEFNSQK